MKMLLCACPLFSMILFVGGCGSRNEKAAELQTITLHVPEMRERQPEMT